MLQNYIMLIFIMQHFGYNFKKHFEKCNACTHALELATEQNASKNVFAVTG